MYFNQKNPNNPANNEAHNIPTFAWKISSGEEIKAKSATKIDIVKPIPPKNDTPNIWLIVLPLGSSAIFNLIASQEIPNIPITFPSTSPAIIPIDTGCKTVEPIELKCRFTLEVQRLGS